MRTKEFHHYFYLLLQCAFSATFDFIETVKLKQDMI